MVELSKCCLFTEEKLSQILLADERNFLSRNYLQWAGDHLSFPSPSSITNHSTTSLFSCKSFFSPQATHTGAHPIKMQLLTVNVLCSFLVNRYARLSSFCQP